MWLVRSHKPTIVNYERKILTTLLPRFFKIICSKDSTGNANASNQTNKKKWPGDEAALRIFYGQRLITAKTVEVLPKGIMAFTVVHTFGDVAGDNGGTYNFFGLDEVSDAQIGFQIGLTNRLNLVLQHTVGN